MLAELELAGVVAQNDGFVEFSRFDQRAPQCAFGDDGQRGRIHLAPQDAQFVQRRMQAAFTFKILLQMILQQADGDYGQFASSHVVKSRLVEDILAVFAAEQLQEVEARFGVAAGKVGELIIADDGTVAVLAQVTGAGVINMQPMGAVDAGSQNRRGFVDQSCRALLVDARPAVFADLYVPVLKQALNARKAALPRIIQRHYQTAQTGAEMTLHMRRQGRHDVLARGRLPAFSTVFDDQRTQRQILNPIQLVALALRTFWNVFRLHTSLQPSPAVPFHCVSSRRGPAFLGFARLLRDHLGSRLFMQAAGLQPGPFGQLLQNLDLIGQRLHLLTQLGIGLHQFVQLLAQLSIILSQLPVGLVSFVPAHDSYTFEPRGFDSTPADRSQRGLFRLHTRRRRSVCARSALHFRRAVRYNMDTYVATLGTESQARRQSSPPTNRPTRPATPTKSESSQRFEVCFDSP